MKKLDKHFNIPLCEICEYEGYEIEDMYFFNCSKCGKEIAICYRHFDEAEKEPLCEECKSEKEQARPAQLKNMGGIS